MLTVIGSREGGGNISYLANRIGDEQMYWFSKLHFIEREIETTFQWPLMFVFNVFVVAREIWITKSLDCECHGSDGRVNGFQAV